VRKILYTTNAIPKRTFRGLLLDIPILPAVKLASPAAIGSSHLRFGACFLRSVDRLQTRIARLRLVVTAGSDSDISTNRPALAIAT
jgi:hypothetical protein